MPACDLLNAYMCLTACVPFTLYNIHCNNMQFFLVRICISQKVFHVRAYAKKIAENLHVVAMNIV